jgi:hypothetical protein
MEWVWRAMWGKQEETHDEEEKGETGGGADAPSLGHRELSPWALILEHKFPNPVWDGERNCLSFFQADPRLLQPQLRTVRRAGADALLSQVPCAFTGQAGHLFCPCPHGVCSQHTHAILAQIQSRQLDRTRGRPTETGWESV